MKNILSLLMAVLLGLFVNAQITLSRADFGNIFYHAIQANDTLVDTATIHIGNPSATTQTWNFATLHNSYTDTLKFRSVGSTSYASSFAAANLAFTQSDQPGRYNYLNANSNGIYIVGQGVDQGNITLTTPNEAVMFNPQQTFLTFPATYNSTFNGSTKLTVVIDTSFTYIIYNVDTLHNVHYSNYTSVIDAWGSITTPSGTYNCLRQKYVEHTLDSIYAHISGQGWMAVPFTTVDSSVTYRWFANAQGFPLVEMNMAKDTINHTWFPGTATWLVSSNTGTNDLVVSKSPITLFPNPAKDEVSVLNTSNEAIMIVVFDAMGNKLGEIKSNSIKTTINTSGYAAGLYSYRIFDANNVSVTTGKFCIIK